MSENDSDGDDLPLALMSSFIDMSYLASSSCRREVKVELMKTIRPLREHDKQTDLLRIVYVSDFVMKRLGVFDGSWIDLKVMDRKTSVRVFEISTDKRRIARAPISIIFNFLNGDERHHVTLCSRNVSDRQECKLAKISRVNAPSSSAYTSYTASLIRHFAIDRVLSVGDVFGVPVSVSHYRDDSILGDNEESSEESSADEDDVPQDFTRRIELVHFRVTSLDNDEKDMTSSKIVSRRFTQLVQKGSVRSKIPRKEDLISFVVSTAKETNVAASLQKNETKTSSNHDKLTKFLRVTASSKAASLILLGGMRGSGKRELVRDVAATVGMHVLECNTLIMMQDLAREQRRQGRRDDKDKSSVLKRLLDRASSLSPCVIHFRRLPSKSLLRDPSVGGILDSAENTFVENLRDVLCGAGREPSVAVIGSTDDIESLTKTMRSCFTHEIEISAPGSKARDCVFRNWLDNSNDDIVDHAVSISAGRCRSDLRNMVAAATTKSLQRNKHSIGFKTEDFDFAASNVEAQSSMGVEQPKVPKVYWDDVGGLEHAKKEIQELIELPLKQPELFAATGGGGRSGILLYGPPGTGKTLLAKAVATECDLNFMSVKGPELLNMYVGESEKNVRDIFQAARDARPCVLFFDELDSLAPARGRGSDGGGVMDRVVSQFLSELDGISGESKLHSTSDAASRALFVIGATNRPDLLDNALLRPGRFDRLVYLGISSNPKEQLKIVRALTRKFNLSKTLDLESIVKSCPRTFTGADFYALCSLALMTAIKRRVKMVQEEEGVMGKKKEHEHSRGVCVEQQDFIVALSRVTPSVSKEEISHYRSLRQKFSHGT